MKSTKHRSAPVSFKTFPEIKKKLIKMAELGDRSQSREMERLIKEEPLTKSTEKR